MALDNRNDILLYYHFLSFRNQMKSHAKDDSALSPPSRIIIDFRVSSPRYGLSAAPACGGFASAAASLAVLFRLAFDLASGGEWAGLCGLRRGI